MQKSPCLDPLDVLGADGHLTALLWHPVDSQTALQHLGVGVAKVAQTILQQVGALALVADQQQFFLLAKTLHLAVYLCQVHIRCTGNLWLNGCVDDSVVLCLALQKFQRRDAV